MVLLIPMTIRDFYATSDDSVLRIEATNYEQITSGGAGECSDEYSIAWTWVYGSRFGGQLSGVSYATGYPPFEIKIIQAREPHPFIDGYTPSTPEAYLSKHDADGNFVLPNGYNRPGARNSARGYPGWLRLCRRSDAPREIFESQSKEGYKLATGYSYENPYISHDGGARFYCRNDALPDDCGGSCETFFYRDNQTIFQLPACPEISEQPPTHCSDCCRELLPLLRSLHI